MVIKDKKLSENEDRARDGTRLPTRCGSGQSSSESSKIKTLNDCLEIDLNRPEEDEIKDESGERSGASFPKIKTWTMLELIKEHRRLVDSEKFEPEELDKQFISKDEAKRDLHTAKQCLNFKGFFCKKGCLNEMCPLNEKGLIE